MRRQRAILPRTKPLKTTCCSRSTGNSPGATFSARETKNSWAGTGRTTGACASGPSAGTIAPAEPLPSPRTIPSPCTPGTGSSLPSRTIRQQHGAMPSTANLMCKKTGRLCLPFPARRSKARGSFLPRHRCWQPETRQIGTQATSDLRHPVPVDMVASVAADGHLSLAGTIHPPGKGPVFVENTSDLHLVPARSRPLSEEQLAAQLTKTGGTSFGIADLELTYDGTLFTPVSEINQVRREFFIRAGEDLVASYRPLPKEVEAAKKRLATFIVGHPSAVSPAAPKTPESQKRPMGIILYTDSIESVEAGTRPGQKRSALNLPGSRTRRELMQNLKTPASRPLSASHLTPPGCTTHGSSGNCPGSPGRARSMRSGRSCPGCMQRASVRAWWKTREPPLPSQTLRRVLPLQGRGV